MAAPNRLRIYGADLSVSAFVLPAMDTRDGNKVVCKSCAPRRTNMRVLANLFPEHMLGKGFFTLYQCSICHTQWAIPWVDGLNRGEE